MNPLNGQINFTTHTSGYFVVCTNLPAWKCGIKVAEIFRDMQIVLKTCRDLDPVLHIANSPPALTAAPFTDAQGNPVFDTIVLCW
jgi:hypothetical protein